MKRIIAALLCICLFCTAIAYINELVIEKRTNRYYMLEKELERRNETYDIAVFGSCHAYTSFIPSLYQELTGLNGYNMSNPSEIIPATYLRMLDQFRNAPPEVAYVEIWGTNAYDTYMATEDLFSKYFHVNVELLPLTLAKLEVINDFDALDVVNDNFPLARYKSRILDTSLCPIDFNYSYEKCRELYLNDQNWLYTEMDNRFSHNGFDALPSYSLQDYPEKQAVISPDVQMEIEPVLLKYVDKIIELCQQYEVTLVFYRAPYVSKETELAKSNFLAKYLESQGIAFYDLEKEISFDYDVDFSDYQHLSESGAEKATKFLAEAYLESIS